MLRIFWTVMAGLTAAGLMLVLTAHTNLQLAAGLMALTLGAGGLSAATLSVAAERRIQLGRTQSKNDHP